MSTYTFTGLLELATILLLVSFIILFVKVTGVHQAEREKYSLPLLLTLVMTVLTAMTAFNYEHNRPLESFLSTSFSTEDQRAKWQEEAELYEAIQPGIATYHIICPKVKVFSPEMLGLSKEDEKEYQELVAEFFPAMPGLPNCFWNSQQPIRTQPE